MATHETSEVQEAAQVITEAATEAVTAEAAIEAAEDAQERAEELAEDLAAAAIEGERGRMLASLREDLETWRAETIQRLESLTTELAQCNLRITEMTQAQTPPVVTVETTTPPTGQPSILPPSPDQPQAETVVTVNPQNVSEDVPPVPVAALERQRRARFL